MKILVSQTIARRHAIRQQKKLVHAFATDLKATGPAGQHKMNCCGPNWPDDLKMHAGQRAHSQCRALIQIHQQLLISPLHF